MRSKYYYYSSDKIKKNEMGRSCGTYDRQEKFIQDFGGETEAKRPLGRPRLSWRIILKWIFGKWDRTWNDVV